MGEEVFWAEVKVGQVRRTVTRATWTIDRYMVADGKTGCGKRSLLISALIGRPGNAIMIAEAVIASGEQC